MLNLTTIVGITASALSAISAIPQLIKIIKEKKAVSVSIPMLLILVTGLSLWVYYGFLLKDVIIIASNALSVLINISVLAFAIHFKRKGGKAK